MRKSSARGALFTSFISLLLCCVMLLGTTFAWFTDTVTTTNNIIQSGALDIEFKYYNGTKYEAITEGTSIFNNTKWEPGHTEVAYLEVSNVGDLALKYQLGMYIASEKGSTNVNEKEFKLSDYIMYDVIPMTSENAFYADRDAAREAAKAGAAALNVNYTENFALEAGAANNYYAVVVYMPEEVGNEANYAKAKGYAKPEIKLGLTVYATQLVAEDDSFGPDYDEDAVYADTYVTTADELVAALAEGGTIALVNDIELANNTTITIPAGADVTLDLGGNTISSSSNKTGNANSEMFLVKGNMTVKNGTLETYNTNNQGWNAMSCIFDITAGGVLNIEDATVRNLGGTDMSFAVHMNNWGEVTLNANNTVFESNYCAIRVFNSGSDMNNVNITNSTLAASNMAFWVHNWTVEDFGTAEKAASQQALLNTNFLDDESDNTIIGKVRYGFTNGDVIDATETMAPTTVVTKDTLQATLNTAVDGTVIYLAEDVAVDTPVIVEQLTTEDKTFVIDGRGNKFDGQIKLDGNSTLGDDALVIKNINFVTDEADMIFVLADGANDVRYAHNITVENCTFTATGAAAKTVVGVKALKAYNVKVVNCVGENLHSLMQAESCDTTVTVENCEVIDSKSGVSFNNTRNAVIKNTKIDSVVEGGYGVRHKGEVANYALTVEDCEISAFVPVLVRNMTGTGYKATFAGTNALTATNDFGYEVVVSGGDWDDDSAEPVAPTGTYTLTGADSFVVKG